MLRIMLLLGLILLTSGPGFSQTENLVDLTRFDFKEPAGNALENFSRIELGKDQRRNVTATAWLEEVNFDPSGGLAGNSSKRDFLLSVHFSGPEVQSTDDGGIAAVKIISPEGNSEKPVRLEWVEDILQAEVSLGDEGEYLIKIGSKLADGKKRIYRFFYDRALLTGQYSSSDD